MTLNEITDRDIRTWRRRAKKFIEYPHFDKFRDAEIAELADEAMLRMEEGEQMEVALVRAFDKLKPIFGW